MRTTSFLGILVSACTTALCVATLAEAADTEDNARVSLARAVHYLLEKAKHEEDGEEKEEDQWFFVPPNKQKKVVDYEEYEVRYREVTRKQPIYKRTYEKYKVLTMISVGESADKGAGVRKKTGRRLVGRKKVGEREVKSHVRDKDGPIVKKHRRRIYGPGGPDVIPHGFYAQNAMALYALQRCGVDRRNHVVSAVSRNLRNFIDAYGMPDKTWDLAWLTIAFSNQFRGHKEGLPGRLASRLLDGQIKDGAGRGLWGPLCIHKTLMVKLFEYEQAMLAKLNRRKKDLARNPTHKPMQDMVAKFEAHHKVVAKRLMEVTQQGLRFQEVMKYFPLENEEMFPKEPKRTHGLPFFIYDRTIGDLERTSLVLFALREARENDCLPKQSYRMKTLGGNHLVPPERTYVVLGRAAAAIAALQHIDGTWSDGNAFQRVNAFNHLPVAGAKGLTRGHFPKLPSRQTLLSTAEGYTALADIGRVMGMNKLDEKHAERFAKGERSAIDAVESYLRRGPEPERKGWQQPVLEDGPGDVPTGRTVSPYDFAFEVSTLHRYRGGSEERNREIWRRLADRIMARQKDDGSWEVKVKQRDDGSWEYKRNLMFSSSHFALWDLLYRERLREGWKKAAKKKAGKNAPPEKPDEAALKRKEDAKVRQYWSNLHRSKYWSPEYPAARTAYSMLLLAEGVRPPVAGVWVPSGNAEAPAVLERARRRMIWSKGIWVSFRRLAAHLPPDETRALPVVFLIGGGSMTADALTMSNVAAYLGGGGMIAAVAGENEAGRSFLDSAEATIGKAVVDARLERIAETSELFRGMVGKRPEINASYDGDRMIAAFIAVQNTLKAPSGKLGPLDAACVLERLIESRADEWLLAREHPTTVDQDDISEEKQTPDPEEKPEEKEKDEEE